MSLPPVLVVSLWWCKGRTASPLVKSLCGKRNKMCHFLLQTLPIFPDYPLGFRVGKDDLLSSIRRGKWRKKASFNGDCSFPKMLLPSPHFVTETEQEGRGKVCVSDRPAVALSKPSRNESAPEVMGPWISAVGNLFHYSQQWAFNTIEDNWKNPRWLPVRYVYALHQIWSSVKWRFVTIFVVVVVLFVYQNPIKQNVVKWMVSIFFLSYSGAAVYTARMRPREGSYSNFLTPAVSENVWCNHRGKETR